uniref:Copper transporter n=1 Tax=Angiostrongylus cantonensis TaxID=6313 RepID=A0A0K0D3E5_ANGCA
MTTAECSAPFLTNPYVNMGMYVIYYWTTLVAMLILYKVGLQALYFVEGACGAVVGGALQHTREIDSRAYGPPSIPSLQGQQINARLV